MPAGETVSVAVHSGSVRVLPSWGMLGDVGGCQDEETATMRSVARCQGALHVSAAKLERGIETAQGAQYRRTVRRPWSKRRPRGTVERPR